MGRQKAHAGAIRSMKALTAVVLCAVRLDITPVSRWHLCRNSRRRTGCTNCRWFIAPQFVSSLRHVSRRITPSIVRARLTGYVHRKSCTSTAPGEGHACGGIARFARAYRIKATVAASVQQLGCRKAPPFARSAAQSSPARARPCFSGQSRSIAGHEDSSIARQASQQRRAGCARMSRRARHTSLELKGGGCGPLVDTSLLHRLPVC